MKTKLAFFLTLLSSAVSAYDLQIGTNHFDMAFETSFISTTLKDFIFNDIQRCYAAYGTNAEITPYERGGYAYYIQADVAEGPYATSQVELPGDIVTNSVGQLALRVPAGLISKYAEAYVFKTNNLAKVQAADDFVDFLGSADFPNISSNAVKNYILYDLTNDNLYAEMAAEIIQEGFSNTYYRPSILGFEFASNYGPPGTNLLVRIPSHTKGKPSPTYDFFPAIWHDGRWKICLWSNWE
jgi:hypothetical protein